MSERTSYPHGTFSWVDLSAKDMAQAVKWYCEVLGWDAAQQDTQGAPPYAMFTVRGKPVAGCGQLSPQMIEQGVGAMWNSYVTVADISAIETRVKELGGEVTMPKMQVMDAGWMAFMVDPTGAHFAVWEANQHIGAEIVNDPGALCWNELHTRDAGKAKAFYTGLFGWNVKTSPMGKSEYTSLAVGDRQNGGLIPMGDDYPPEVPSHWMVYFSVEDVDATLNKSVALGGKTVMSPTQIPDVGTMAIVHDPQGAAFTIIKLDQIDE